MTTLETIIATKAAVNGEERFLAIKKVGICMFAPIIAKIALLKQATVIQITSVV